MKHLILFIICFLSVEICIRSNYIFLINEIIKLGKSAISIILKKNISDHRKENIIPKYSLKMMNYSLRILFIFFLIIFIFFLVDFLFNGFLSFTLTWKGIIESVLLAFSYAYIRKIILI